MNDLRCERCGSNLVADSSLTDKIKVECSGCGWRGEVRAIELDVNEYSLIVASDGIFNTELIKAVSGWNGISYREARDRLKQPGMLTVYSGRAVDILEKSNYLETISVNCHIEPQFWYDECGNRLPREDVNTYSYLWQEESDEYVLVSTDHGYVIIHEGTHGFLLIEDDELYGRIVEKMLGSGNRTYKLPEYICNVTIQ